MSFRVPLFLQLIPALLLAVGTLILPYSPRWLASQSRDTDALAVLTKLRQRPMTDPTVMQEWHEIKVEVAMEKDTSTTWKEMWQGRIRRRTMIGMGIMFFQQFSGINALLYYAYDLGGTWFSVVLRYSSRLGYLVRPRFYEQVERLTLFNCWHRCR